MQLRNLISKGILYSLCFIIFTTSCKNHQTESLPTNNTSPNPTQIEPPKPDLFNTNGDIGIHTPIIGDKEVQEIIKTTELLRALIKESLTQLLYDHNFNSAMPAFDFREPCNSCPDGGTNDCGCPFHDASQDAIDNGNGTYPETVVLKYYDPDGCVCTLSSGLEVTGEVSITLDLPFSDPDHTISIVPNNANFTVDGYDLDATEILLDFRRISTDGNKEYRITALNQLAVTKDGETTTVNGAPGSRSLLTIIDQGVSHGDGDLTNAFGLLDDQLILDLIALDIHCSNGVTVEANTLDNEDLIYDMSCNNIQDGMIELTDRKGTETEDDDDVVVTYDYGAPATGGDAGVCDDEITITYPTSN